MADLIDRQAAIDAADRADYTGLAVEDVKKVTDEVVKELKKLPSTEPEQQWILCSERLPEDDGEYSVTKKCFGWNCKKYYESDIARYEKRDGWHKADEVIAWMPLPEPYREEGEAK